MKTRALMTMLVMACGCERLLDLGDDSRGRLATCSSMTSCTLVCEQGFATDVDGCERCECAPVDAGPGCAPTICALACRDGFERDEAGCERCACKLPSDAGAGGAVSVDAGTVDAGGAVAVDAGCTTGIDCALPCPFGFARDIAGCEVCACAAAPVDAGCGPTFCTLPCQFGFKRSAEGCGLCECSPRPAATCTPPACQLTCPAGFKQDSTGCNLCECSR